jgi:hypothetical protein
MPLTNFGADLTVTPPVHRTGSCYIALNRLDGLEVAPLAYSTLPDVDFGLCDNAFLYQRECKRGTDCPWRHHELSDEEINDLGIKSCSRRRMCSN